MSNRYTFESTKTRGFLTPLTGPPLVPLVPPLPSMEEVLQFLARRAEAAPELRLGGIPAGGTRPGPADSPTDDLASAELPNLLIRVVLQSCTNTTVKGDGVNKSLQSRVSMSWFVEQADDVFSQDDQNIPQPDEELNYSVVHGMYRAIAFDGCTSNEVVPIGLNAFIDIEPGTKVGSFSAFDPETIRPGGRWTFNFTIRASKDEGDHQSDFRFHGMIDATCTNSKVSAP